MNIDLGSFAFGSTLEYGAGTPSWGTALGQSFPEYKITYPGSETMLIGMVYCSVPLKYVSLPIGKGGSRYTASSREECQIAALFRKVYINNTKINYPFVMVLFKEESDSHPGRKAIKYSDKNDYNDGSEHYSNQEFINAALTSLGIQKDACWFVYKMEVHNQDELHLYAVIVDKDNSVVYENSSERKRAWLQLIPEVDDFYIPGNIEHIQDNPLQQIFYGAPGTGKSHTINEITETQPKENVFRTTFHPDSDYSTFVGCYKPTKIKTRRQQRMNLSLEDLAKELGSYYSNEELGKISGIQKFCYEYYPYIDGEYMSVNVTKLLELAGIPKDYNVEINKYVKFCHLFPKQDPDKITYEFVPQTFTKAYLRAWQTEEPVYLVIEEINRGNCAQIFGDLFQILDRKNGMSEYPIKADNDLAAYIGEQLSKESREGIPETVKSGEELILPSNLYIWATMNTSDQSLFPIDSAFKRRWEWKYLPINNHEDKNYKIEAGNNKYDWWGFLSKINEVIGNTTSSEDKKLGYFFAKADENGIVNAEQFVGKVLFYLWNDVFKNYGFDNQIFDKGDEKKFEFSDFFKQDGNPDTDMVIRFLKKLDETVDKENSFDEKIKGDKGQEELSDTEA